MSEQHYQGMRAGDLEGKPYARFWQPRMRPLPAEVADALRASPPEGALGLDLNEASRLLQPGYLPLENGFTELEDGRTFVAERTDMPGCTGVMEMNHLARFPRQLHALYHAESAQTQREKDSCKPDEYLKLYFG